MHAHTKSDTCPNCGTHLRSADHFCPGCGQENHELKIPFKELILELFESVFHFETRFFLTLKTISTNPGQITRDFWQGKRARYMHPFRMYIFVSFLFFLIANKVADKKADELETTIREADGSRSVRVAELKDLIGNGNQRYSDSLLNVMDLEKFAGLDLAVPTEALTRYDFIRELKQAENIRLDSLLLKKAIPATAANRAGLRRTLSLIPDHSDIPTQVEVGPINLSFKTLRERQTFVQNLENYSIRQLDSILIGLHLNPNAFNRTFLKQAIRVGETQQHVLQDITHVFLKRLSIIMFILMPFVACSLLLMFRRRHRYYFEHLIFSVHSHTVLFLLLSLALLAGYFVSIGFLIAVAWFTGWIYCFLSLKIVYRESWLGTIWKFLILSAVYLVTLMVFLGGAFLWGFMTF